MTFLEIYLAGFLITSVYTGSKCENKRVVTKNECIVGRTIMSTAWPYVIYKYAEQKDEENKETEK